jgi:hypothetical protein
VEELMIERLGPFLAAMLLTGAAHGADCPDGKTAEKGFVLERPGVRSVFRPSPEKMVQVTNSFDASPPQTQYYLGGLIEIFRTSKTGNFAVFPLADVRGIFPLKEDAKDEVKWLELDPERDTMELGSLALQVTGKETIKLGACEYEVLAVKLTFKAADGAEIDAWTALFAPDLQAVLARRYDEGANAQSTVAYRSIKPLIE